METIHWMECLEASKSVVDQLIPITDLLLEITGKDPEQLPPPEPIKCPVFTW